VGNWLKQLIAT